MSACSKTKMPMLKYVVFVFAEEARLWCMAWAWASYLSVDSGQVQDLHPGALCVGGLLTPSVRSLLLLSVLAKLKSAEGWHIHGGVQTWFKKKIIAASVLSPKLSLDDSSVIRQHPPRKGGFELHASSFSSSQCVKITSARLIPVNIFKNTLYYESNLLPSILHHFTMEK